MKKEFHIENRSTLYGSLEKNSLVILFAGTAPRRTRDEYYPFFANRNFVYLTGIEQAESVFVAVLNGTEQSEVLYILPPDAHAERWMGRRIKPDEASEQSGVTKIHHTSELRKAFDGAILSGNTQTVYLDFDKYTSDEPDNEAYKLAAYIKERFPFITVKNLQPNLKHQRTFKKPCEIEAMKYAETITRDGILAMMKASKPGMYEYQYKAEFDYALSQKGVLVPASAPIISVGTNNFCIHYYGYKGQANDGDFVLNDVGAIWDNVANDVSRGWPVNGKFSERQRLLYQCAYNTSEYMFGLLKPGMPMADVDLTIRKYNFEQLRDIGLCDKYENIGKLMWHGGAHHVGYDVHDLVDATLPLAPCMVFCVDIGIYCEEWGIGFRLEDNCLITESGCENLSAITPRSIEDIEAFMGKR